LVLTLTLKDHLEGGLALLFVVISLLIGIRLIIRFIIYKDKILLFAGLTWIGMVSTWYSPAFNYIYVLITGTSISNEFYFWLGYFWMPFTIIFWSYVYTGLVANKHRKIIIGTCIIHAIIFIIVFDLILFTDYTIISEKNELFNADASPGFSLYIISILIIVLITGIHFGMASLKTKAREIRLRGKFLIIACLSFFLGALLDSGLIPLSPFLLILSRLILISSGFEFSLGFFLPKFIKKILLKS